MKKILPILAGLITFIVVFFGLYSILNSFSTEISDYDILSNSSFYIWILLILIIAVLLVILYFVMNKESEEKEHEDISPLQKNVFDDQFLSDILEVINFHQIVFRKNEFTIAIYYEKLVYTHQTLRIIEDRLYLSNEKKLLEAFTKYHYNLNKLTSNLESVDYDRYISILANIKKEILEILKESKTNPDL